MHQSPKTKSPGPQGSTFQLWTPPAPKPRHLSEPPSRCDNTRPGSSPWGPVVGLSPTSCTRLDSGSSRKVSASRSPWKYFSDELYVICTEQLRVASSFPLGASHDVLWHQNANAFSRKRAQMQRRTSLSQSIPTLPVWGGATAEQIRPRPFSNPPLLSVFQNNSCRSLFRCRDPPPTPPAALVL